MVVFRCPRCGSEAVGRRPVPAFYCLTCRAVVPAHAPAARRARAGRRWALPRIGALAGAVLLSAGLLVGQPCGGGSRHAAERAAMRYVAVLSERWGRQPAAWFEGVATATHARELIHPAAVGRAIFSPYLQWVQIGGIEVGCRESRVELTVATGYKPALALPRDVVLVLVPDRGGLVVAGVEGR